MHPRTSLSQEIDQLRPTYRYRAGPIYLEKSNLSSDMRIDTTATAVPTRDTASTCGHQRARVFARAHLSFYPGRSLSRSPLVHLQDPLCEGRQGRKHRNACTRNSPSALATNRIFRVARELFIIVHTLGLVREKQRRDACRFCGTRSVFTLIYSLLYRFPSILFFDRVRQWASRKV